MRSELDHLAGHEIIHEADAGAWRIDILDQGGRLLRHGRGDDGAPGNDRQGARGTSDTGARLSARPDA